jgi:very-short-patch-repair endonuclease
MAESKDDNLNREIEVWSRDKTPEQILLHARNMRKNPTESEELLWTRLRGKRLNKLKFRRQQHLQGFILDFYCESARLGVEVDGEIHFNKEQAEFDKQRSEYLSEFSIKIIRFTNDQVLKEIQEVLNTISQEAMKRVLSLTPSSFLGHPSPRGEGQG